MSIAKLINALFFLDWMCLSIYSRVSQDMLSNLSFMSPDRISFIILMLSYLMRPVGAYFFRNKTIQSVLKVGFLLIAISCFCFVFSVSNGLSILFAILGRCLQSFCIGTCHGSGHVAIYENEVIKKNKYVNFKISLAQISIFVGLLLGDVAVLVSSYFIKAMRLTYDIWRASFIIPGIVALVCCYLSYKMAFSSNFKKNHSNKTNEGFNSKFVIKSFLVALVISVEMSLFYFSYIYLANTSGNYNISTRSNEIFWLIHKITVILSLPSIALFCDMLNEKYAKLGNYLILCVACVSFLFFGLFFSLWPNIILAYLLMIAFLACYSVFISWSIERFVSAERYVLGILFNVLSVLIGGPMPFLASCYGHNIIVFSSAISLLALVILWRFEDRLSTKQVSSDPLI